jgi:flavorubredoxin
MAIVNSQAGTSVNEIADGIYRISTPAPAIPGGFMFNQYLVRSDAALLFHTGPRRLFPLIRDAVASVLPLTAVRYISFSHYEADECGSLNEWLAAASNATALCGRIASMTSVRDVADRPPQEIANGEVVSLGAHSLKWFDMPHVPHGWDCGYLFEERTRTLLCSDLFTQPGSDLPSLTESDLLGPSESLRTKLDYFSHARNTGELLERLALANPQVLACMHGSAWRGDGAALIRELASIVSK